MEAVLPGSQTDYDRQMVERLQRQAVKCWYQPGHPGWSIWPADSEQFVQGVCSAQPGAVAPGPVQIVAPVPMTLTSGNPPPRNGMPLPVPPCPPTRPPSLLFISLTVFPPSRSHSSQGAPLNLHHPDWHVHSTSSGHWSLCKCGSTRVPARSCRTPSWQIPSI
jgi:hypothetical protein